MFSQSQKRQEALQGSYLREGSLPSPEGWMGPRISSLQNSQKTWKTSKVDLLGWLVPQKTPPQACCNKPHWDTLALLGLPILLPASSTLPHCYGDGLLSISAFPQISDFFVISSVPTVAHITMKTYWSSTNPGFSNTHCTLESPRELLICFLGTKPDQL